MHGRIKVRTSEEQAEAKRKEQQEKLKIYLALTGKIFTKRKAGELDEEALQLTATILGKNPDFYTLWNYRREVLLSLKLTRDVEELKLACLNELDLTQHCLRANPKSYSAWHHRLWVMNFHPDGDWNRELKLCDYFLTMDDRNFHCWDYRRSVAGRCGVSAEDELKRCTELIESNFSNYSAWHYRSTLLRQLHFDKTKNAINEEVLLTELDLVQNAAFTDPDDQSVWFYHRWLLGRNEPRLEILNVTVSKPQKCLYVLLSKPYKADICLSLKINGEQITTTWSPVAEAVSPIWKCELPSLLVSEVGDKSAEVSVELLLENSSSVLICDVNGEKSFAWSKTSRAELFRAEISAATKDVLKNELESCQQLIELEPDSKWTMFTCVLLMRALNDQNFATDIQNFMDKLCTVDSSRRNYYKDLGSKFQIEDAIEQLPFDCRSLDLSKRNLSSLYHFEQLILIEKLNLSSNKLKSAHQLRYLVNVKELDLDDNELTSLDDVHGLNVLEKLSVKRNFISDADSLCALATCSSLRSVFLQGNPVASDPSCVLNIRKLPAIESCDIF